MGKGRLEAFSDRVIAIIMVLEMKVPYSTALALPPAAEGPSLDGCLQE